MRALEASNQNGHDPLDPTEVMEPNELARIESPSAIEQITRGEVDMQVATAKRFPRSLKTFKQRALTLATLDQATAESCFYALPRGGKTIEGPSVRLAEIVASEWGNLRTESRIIEEGERFIVAQATCWDMERNLLVRSEVRRRITDKSGNRFNDDMIGVTGAAACKIAFRNAVFSVVPRAYVDDVYRRCRQVAAGDARTLSTQRAEWFAFWLKRGIAEGRVLAALGKPSVEDVDLDDLAKMKGLATAIKDGDTTLEEAFPPEALKEGTFGFGRGRRAAAPEPDPNEPPHDEVTGEVTEEPAQTEPPRSSAKPLTDRERAVMAESKARREREAAAKAGHAVDPLAEEIRKAERAKREPGADG